MMSDPQVEIGQALSDRGVLDIYVDDVLEKAMSKMPGAKPIEGGSYQVGMYQPAILVVSQDSSKLFAWASVPGAGNIGGAIGRPTAADALRAIKAGLAGDSSLVKWNPDTSEKAGGMHSMTMPPLVAYFFFAMIFANGNFLEPVSFEFDAGSKTSMNKQYLKAGSKIAAAAVLFAAAARRRPAPPAAALGLYSTYIYMVWGEMIQNLWKPLGANPKDSVLRRRRAAKL